MSSNIDPISAKIKGYKFASNVIAVALGLFMAMGVFVGFSLFRKYSIPSDGSVVVRWQGKEYPAGEFYRKVLPQIQKKLPFMPFDQRSNVEVFLREFNKNLSRYYPKFPLLPWVITKYPGGKKWALSGYAITFLLTLVPPLIIIRRYRTLKREAFRVAELEPPVPLGKPDSSLIRWEEVGIKEEEAVRELFGGDREAYEEVLAYFDGQIISDKRVNYLSECPKKPGFVCYPVKEINELAGKLAREIKDYGVKRKFLKSKEEERLALMTYFFALVHYASRQFGNIPVGYLNTKMKNPVVKRFFSNYYLERLMLLDGGATEEEKKASRLLEAFYFYSRRREKDGKLPPLKELLFRFRQVPPATFMEFKDVRELASEGG